MQLFQLFAISTLMLCADSLNSRGDHFLMVFMKQFYHVNASPYYPGKNKLILTSDVAATVTVDIPSVKQKYNIQLTAGHGYTHEIQPLFRMSAGQTGYYVVEIVASTNISAYAVNVCDLSTDGTVLFPLPELGYEYYIASYDPLHFASIAAVVSTTNNTVVTFTPVGSNTSIQTVTLQNKEAFMLEDMNNDLTGMFVNSSEPVAVFSGHICSEVYAGAASSPVPQRYNVYCSHLYEQLPPVSTWGTDYNIIPTPSRSFNVYRIVSHKACSVTISNNPHTSLSLSGAGDFKEFNISDFGSSVVCSQPCMLIQYIPNSLYDLTSIGDPDMTIVPPVTAYSNNYVLLSTSGATQMRYTGWVIIIAPHNATTGLTVNLQSISSSSWGCINATGYAVALIPTGSSTRVQIQHNDQRVKFFALMYGTQWNDGFSYVGGWDDSRSVAMATGSCPYGAVVTITQPTTVITTTITRIILPVTPRPRKPVPSTTQEPSKFLSRNSVLAITIPILLLLIVAIAVGVGMFCYAKKQRELRKRNQFIDPSKIYINGHGIPMSEIEARLQRLQDEEEEEAVKTSRLASRPYRVDTPLGDHSVEIDPSHAVIQTSSSYPDFNKPGPSGSRPTSARMGKSAVGQAPSMTSFTAIGQDDHGSLIDLTKKQANNEGASNTNKAFKAESVESLIEYEDESEFETSSVEEEFRAAVDGRSKSRPLTASNIDRLI